MDKIRFGRKLDTRPLQYQEGVRSRQFGRWGESGFQFNSKEDEALWQRSAYRQSVKHDEWDAQPPVDEHTQATFEAMPELAEGSHFRGPDGRHRAIGPAHKETPEIDRIRRRAFSEFASQGVTWEELGAYDPKKPHPGEDEVIARIQSQTQGVANSAQKDAAWRNKHRDMGALPKEEDKFLGDVGNIAIDNNDLESWGGSKLKAGESPVLVANNGKPPSGMPKFLMITSEIPVGSRTPPTFQRRHDFNRQLVGILVVGPTKQTQAKTAAQMKPNEVSPLPTLPDPAPQRQLPSTPATVTLAESAASLPADPEVNVENRLFNWRDEKPAPEEFAVYVASDEGRFTYLEDKKDEWSVQLRDNPESVLSNMLSEVEKLSVLAQRELHLSYREAPNKSQITQINDALERIVFAPAEHWSREQAKPNESKSYFGIAEAAPVKAVEALSIFDEIINSLPEANRRPGKLGNETTQRHVPSLAKKMLEELRRCGIQLSDEPIKYEKQIKITSANKGARWGDFRIEFDVDGRTYAWDINHAAYLKSKHSRTRGEQAAFSDIVSFREINANGNGILDHEGAVISFPKIRKNQTEEEYMKQMDDFIKSLVDCKSPVKIRVTNPYDVKIIRRMPDETANEE